MKMGNRESSPEVKIKSDHEECDVEQNCDEDETLSVSISDRNEACPRDDEDHATVHNQLLDVSSLATDELTTSMCVEILNESEDISADEISLSSHNSALHYMDNDHGPCCFTLIMSSTLTKETKEKVLSLSGYPNTGLVLKNQIQSKLKIPTCVQTLSFASQPIKDDVVLKSVYLQHEDTILLEYTMSADIEYFTDLIGTLTRIKDLLSEVVVDLMSGASITSALHDKLQTDCSAFASDCVPLRYFSVFPTGSPNANQLFFLNLGGLSLLVRIYKLVQRLPWHKLPHELQSLEYACLQIIWNFSATLGIRQLIVDKGVMQLVFKTLNRAKIVPNKHLELPEALLDQFVVPQQSLNTLAEAVYASLVVTGNFAEMPQCRLPIALSSEVIETLLAAMLSPTYTYTCARSGMCAMLCLSFSPSTHQYINQKVTLERVLEICHRTHLLSDGTSDKERSINQTLVGFYSLLFFCNLAHHWTVELTALPLESELTQFMTRFVFKTTHDEILKRMQEKRYYWSTFIPFLSLCYCPSLHMHSDNNNHIPKNLLEVTVKAGVLSMKCMCLSENALEVIEYEGLKDYITCVSWNNSSFTDDIKCLLSEVSQVAQENLRFQPPSLCNIVKAMLASHYCGLEKVLEEDTYSLIFHLVRNLT